MGRVGFWFSLWITLLGAPCVTAQTATVDGVQIAVKTLVNGLNEPVMATAPLGDKRLFIVEKGGRILIWQSGKLLDQPFLDISADISTQSERGLLGLAFHPDFAANGRLFVYFNSPQGDIEISEYRVVKDPNRANENSRRKILTVPHRENSNHNGGWLGFGPDGFLYIGTGDGGSGGDPPNNAQNTQVLLGKILRIDVNKGSPYAIPPTNPFAKSGGAPEIFALGLRNPWRAAFDGNDLYIGDVGQDRWEEIDVITPTNAGANLGWRVMEGKACYNAAACTKTGLALPVYVYNHDSGCSVTGGFVYRGKALPALAGRYFFSDFCSGELMSFRLKAGAAKNFANLSADLGSLGQVSSFGQDGKGELYVLTISGDLRKIVAAAP